MSNFEGKNPGGDSSSRQMAGDSLAPSISKEGFMEILKDLKKEGIIKVTSKEERDRKIKEVFNNRAGKSAEELKIELKNKLSVQDLDKEKGEAEKIYAELKESGQLYFYDALSQDFIKKTIKNFCDNYKEKTYEKSKIEQVKDRLKDLNTEEKHLKYFGLEPLLKGYLGKISRIVGDEQKVAQIRKEVIEKLFSESNQNMFSKSDMEKRSNDLQKRLVEILEEEKNNWERRKKA